MMKAFSGGPTLIFFDDFNRSDRDLNGDNGWSDYEGSGRSIVSNTAQNIFGVSGLIQATGVSAGLILSATVAIAGLSVVNGLTFRFINSANHFYLLVGNTAVQLYNKTLGTFNLEASTTWDATPALGELSFIEIKDDGSTITINGLSATGKIFSISHGSTLHNTGGGQGMRGNATGSTSIIDDFSVYQE